MGRPSRSIRGIGGPPAVGWMAPTACRERSRLGHLVLVIEGDQGARVAAASATVPAFDVPSTQQVAPAVLDRGEASGSDGAPERAGVPPNEDRRLIDGQRVTRLVEVAVMAEVHVIDR